MDKRYRAILPDAELRFVRSIGEASRALAVAGESQVLDHACDFIDFRDYPDNAEGNAKIRQGLLACLAEKGPHAEHAA